MPVILDLQSESLIYKARFSRPLFEFWGNGGKIISNFYDALEPYNVTLQNFQLSPSMATAADTVLTFQLGSTVLKFSFVSLEVSFSKFSESEFERIPGFLNAVTRWLKQPPASGFATHHFSYLSHSFLSGQELEDFLRTVNSVSISNVGVSLPGGAIFHHLLPREKWVTQLLIDRSTVIPGALFIGFIIEIGKPEVDYELLLAQGREFFSSVIGKFGLEIPNTTAEENKDGSTTDVS